MTCPNCGGKVRVINSANNTDDNEVYRRRECTVCGSRFYTTEFLVEHTDEFKQLWNAYVRQNLK